MKLTQKYIDNLPVNITYFYHNTLTICVIDLVNGATVVGQSNVIDPNNYNKDIGDTIAFEDAIDKIWQLEGYAMKTRDIHD